MLKTGMQADPVALPEGEKCAEALQELGFIVVTNPFGASGWKDDYSDECAGWPVILFADADEPGRSHVRTVAHSLQGKAASIKIVDLYPDRTDGSGRLRLDRRARSPGDGPAGD